MKIVSLLIPVFFLVATSSTARAQAPSEADLVSCLGTKKAWTPTVFAKLKEKMSPAEAAQVLPGADQVSKYGFATVKADGCAGAAEFELYFAKNKKTEAFELRKATILFTPTVSADAAFYASLVKVTTAKYGKIKRADEVTKKLITWANRKFKIAQVHNKPQRSGDTLALSVTL